MKKLLSLLCLSFGLIAGAASASPSAPVSGKDYTVLSSPQPVEVPAGKIEVVEFFWYSCKHCNAFEPKLVAWQKRQSDDVVLRRVPAAFRDAMVPEQRLFYTLEAMGKLDELHGKVYESVHDKQEPVHQQDMALAFAAKNGLDRAKFQELYNSFAVSTKARKAKQLQDQYEVDGVPALGVNGQFYTDGTLAAGMDRALVVVDYLIAEARRK